MNARRPADSARASVPKSSANLSADARRSATTQNTLRPLVCGCARCMVRKAAGYPVNRYGNYGPAEAFENERWSGEEDWKMTPVSLVPLKKESHWSVLLDTLIMLVALALAIGALYALG